MVQIIIISAVHRDCCPYVPSRIGANNTAVFICQYLRSGAVAEGHVGKSSCWYFRIGHVSAQLTCLCQEADQLKPA